MQYQKIINLLDDTTNQQSKFGTRNWVEINYESRGIVTIVTIMTTAMIWSNLSDYSAAFIHIKATITVPNTAAAAAPVNNTNKK